MNSELKWNLKSKEKWDSKNILIIFNFTLNKINFFTTLTKYRKKLQNFNIFISSGGFIQPSPTHQPAIFSTRSFIIPWALYTKLVQNFYLTFSARFEWIKTRRHINDENKAYKTTSTLGVEYVEGASKFMYNSWIHWAASLLIEKNLARLVSSCEWNVNLLSFFFFFHFIIIIPRS